MIDNLTFDQLPLAVSQLGERLVNIERLLTDKDPQQSNIEQLLNIEECAQFLNLSKATIYSKVSKGELPHMKRSKRLYFSSVDLLEYVKGGRNKTNKEIEAETDTYLNIGGGKK